MFAGNGRMGRVVTGPLSPWQFQLDERPHPMSDQTANGPGHPPRSPLEERLSRIREGLSKHGQAYAPDSKSGETTAFRADHGSSAHGQPALDGEAHLESERDITPPPSAPIRMATSAVAGAHPVSNLQRLARRFHSSGAHHSLDLVDDAVPGPEGMNDIASRLGLSLSMETRRPGSLVTADCPCVLLLKDGSSHLVIDAADRVVLTCDAASGPIKVDRKTLEAMATGTIFVARPVGQHAAMPLAEGPQPPAIGFVELVRSGLDAQRRTFWALVVAGLASAFISLSIPIFTMAVFDRVIPHMAMETLWALGLGVVLLLLMDLAIRHSKVALIEGISVAAGQGIMARLFNRILTVPLAAVPRHASHVVQPLQELSSASGLSVQFLASLMVDLPFFLIVVGYLWLIAGPIAALPVLATVMIVALHWSIHRAITRKTAADAHLQQIQQQLMMDGIAGIETIKATRAAPGFLAQWEQKSDEAAYSSHRLRLLHGMAAHGSATLTQLLIVFTLIFGVYQIRYSGMSIGALSACLMLVGRMALPMSGLVGSYFRLRQMAMTTRSLRVVLATTPEKAGDSDSIAPEIDGRIDLRQASFSYPDETVAALQGLTLSIAPHERIGIIGRAGCGKTTLLKVLARLYDPSQGTHLVDGRDARQMDPFAIRRAFSLMGQETTLMDGTVDANLRLGLGSLDQDWLATVLQITGVGDLVNKHPKGLSLPVGPGGRRLSGGERQSIALARALLGKPKMLLLDEPTAAMDNEREMRVVGGLQKQCAGMGMIIATHRLPLLAAVDRIIVMDGGCIAADGPRDEIFAKIGLKTAA
jgi:ATP-binding cassette, subfamily C, bacterial LapB